MNSTKKTRNRKNKKQGNKKKDSFLVRTRKSLTNSFVGVRISPVVYSSK